MKDCCRNKWRKVLNMLMVAHRLVCSALSFSDLGKLGGMAGCKSVPVFDMGLLCGLSCIRSRFDVADVRSTVARASHFHNVLRDIFAFGEERRMMWIRQGTVCDCSWQTCVRDELSRAITNCSCCLSRNLCAPASVFCCCRRRTQCGPSAGPAICVVRAVQ